MRQNPPDASVVSVRGTKDAVARHGVEYRVLAVFSLAGIAVAADGVPCVGVGKGEAVGAHADDVAVLFVEGMDDE